MRPALPAKLCEPRPGTLVPRPRVAKRLAEAAHRKLIWVSGPAGAGKTSAVIGWLTSTRLTRCWYRVDSGDRDVANVFYYLGRATKRALPTLSLEVSAEAFARRFFEAWFDGGPRVFVLDDLHAAAGGLDELVRVAVETVPDGVTIVCISRDEPPAKLARAFASRDAERIDWDVLRLTTAEARGMARALARTRPHSHKIVDALHGITDGWPAGLALLLAFPDAAKLAGLDRDAIAGQLRESGGAQRIFDYIASEVFEHEDPLTQRFLLRTAMLPALTDARARALTDGGIPRAVIRLGAGPFLKREAPNTVRLHPLFRAFLLQRAEAQLAPEALAELRRQTGTLLVDEGELELGFELLRQTQSWPRCAAVIERVAPQLIEQGRRITLRGWLAALPEDVVHGSAWLLFWLATCDLPFAPSAAMAWFGEAFERFRGERDALGAQLAWSSRVAACVHAGTDLSPIDGWLVELDELDPDGAMPATIGHLLALFRQPGHPAAARWIRDATEYWSNVPDPSLRAMMAALLVPLHCFAGELGHAAAILDLIGGGDRDKLDPLAEITRCNGEAVFAWVTADHATCIASAERGLALATRTGIVAWNDQLAALGAAAALAAEDLAAAAPFLARMAETASHGSAFTVGNFLFYLAWDAVLRGQLSRALVSIDAAVGNSDRTGYPFAQVTSRIARAHVLARLGRDPRPDLTEARRVAVAAHSPFFELSCDVADACLDDDPAALARAIGTGRALGAYNVFWWLREPMARLCARALADELEPAYVTELIRRHRLVAPGPQISAWPFPIKIRALGGLEVVSAGHVQKLANVPRRLLATIIALGGRDVPEARLVDALWPDSDGDAGRIVLHTTLHRLRRTLGVDDAIRFRAGAIDLEPAVVWLDTWALDDACGRVERCAERDEPALAAAVEEVVALYTGPLLGELDIEGHIDIARQRIRARVTRVVLAAGSAYEARGQHDLAQRLYERALDRDDASEPLYQRMMMLLDQRGQCTTALEWFSRCEARLAVDHATPSPATREIHRRIQDRLAM
jgi:DNA-binding SARP family transcriptional activator